MNLQQSENKDLILGTYTLSIQMVEIYMNFALFSDEYGDSIGVKILCDPQGVDEL